MFRLSESGVGQQANDVRPPIKTGQYRFLLIGASPSPQYAIEFEVLPEG
jgi:hypothetical protein